MKVLTFFSQKGGSGKTTLAVHCAVAAAAKAKVALLDADPQGSALAWSEARAAEHPVVEAVSTDQIGHALDVARQNRFGWVVIDAPPHASRGVSDLLPIADLIVIPVRPTVLDLAALPKAVDMVRAAGRPAIFVLNAAKPRVSETEEVRQAIADGFDYPVARTVIYDRTPFSRALATGKAVAEFAPVGPAASEIHSLWDELGKHSKVNK